MAGRPPKPIAFKLRDGDTRKLGANKFAQAIAGAHEPQLGVPPMPPELEDIPAPAHEEPGQCALRKSNNEVLATARRHWQELAEQLSAEQLLALCDEGILTTAAMLYAHLVHLGRHGQSKAMTEAARAYSIVSNLMGTNASARAKIPKNEKQVDALEAALCG